MSSSSGMSHMERADEGLEHIWFDPKRFGLTLHCVNHKGSLCLVFSLISFFI